MILVGQKLRASNRLEKFSTRGLFSAEALRDRDLPADLVETAIACLNGSISARTWSSYKSALNSLSSFSIETKVKITWPLTENTLIAYTAWAIKAGKRASTVSLYLSGLKKVQLSMGLPAVGPLPDIVTAMLKGHSNRCMIAHSSDDSKKLPCTLNMLKLVKRELRNDPSQSKYSKAMIWAAVCSLFFGALRGGELLCRNMSEYDPRFTLLNKDVKFSTVSRDGEKKDIVTLRIKHSKTSREV